MRTAKTLDEATSLFADDNPEKDSPVTCSKDGADDQVCNNLGEAEAFYAE